MEETKTDIFNQDAGAKESSAEEKKRRQREIGDLRKILSIPEGRRFIWKQLSEAGIFRSPFNMNSKLEDFACGTQNVGLELLKSVNEADTYAFAKMQQEYISEQKSKKEEKETKEAKQAPPKQEG